MSKKYNQDTDSPESEFKRIADEFSTSVDNMTREFDQKNGQANEPLVDDSEEEDKATFKLWSQIWFQMLSVFPFLYRLTVAGVKKTASFGYFLGQKVTALPRHLVSFFNRKKDKNNEGGEKFAQNTQSALANQSRASAKPAVKTAASNPKLAAATSKPTAPSPQAAVASQVDMVDDDEFDGENRKFSWSKLGFKVTSAAAVALLVTGSYIGVKSFFGKSSVEPEIEVVLPSEPPAAENPLPADPFAAQVVADKVVSQAESEIKPSLEQSKQFDKKPESEIAVKKHVTKFDEIAKNEPFQSNSEKDKVKESEKNLSKPDAKKPDVKKEIAANTKEAAPKAESKTEQKPKETAAADDPFATLASSISSEKPKSTSSDTAVNDPWGLDTKSAPITSDTNHSFGSKDLTPTTEPQTPSTLATKPEKPLTLDATAVAASPVTANTESSPVSASLLDSLTPPSASLDNPAPAISTAASPLKETKSAPATDLAPLKLPEELASSQLAPLKMSVIEETKPINEQALAIPKTNDRIQSVIPEMAFSEPASKTASNMSAGFSKAPTPPELTSPISPSAVEPPMPVAVTKKDEIAPAIPNSGTVQHFTVTPPPAPAGIPAEPSPGIPADSAAFNSIPKLAAVQAAKTAADFTPPAIGKDTQNAAMSFAAKSAAETQSFVPKINEPTPAIPKDSSPAMPSAAAVPAVSTAIPAMLPQHEELAKIEPPLGSQLQKQVQEMRNQDNSESEPRLRFGSAPNAKTGAVRYHPKSTIEATTTLAQPLPMPMSTEPNNPESNPLADLLPTGNVKPGMEDSLPPLTAAPQPVYATANPAYHNLVNQNISASTKPETVLRSTANNESRASLFQRRVNEEIKRSPVSAEQYTVQANDTYLTISDRFFGTGKLFRALAEYNRQKYGTDYKLVEGTIVEIPTADYLKTNFTEAFSRGRSRPESNTTNNSTKNSTTPLKVNYASMYPAQPQGSRYTVQEGDTVFRIATNQLRDSSRWQEIMRLNPAQLHDPRDLQPGMEIVLPTNITQTALR